MSKFISTFVVCLVVLVVPAAASAQCYSLFRGYLVFNHRTSRVFGSNFSARVTCSRYVPTYIYWLGGPLCVGGSFYGRNGLGQRYSCLVRSVTRR